MAQTNYTPISLYYSTTASAVPTAANLVQGELAINTADGKLYYEDSSGVVQVLATKSTGSIGGSNTQVQFNNSGSLGGSSSFTWDGTTVTATKFAGALNGTVGATTASTGAFTTLTSNGATTFTAGTASTSTTTGTTVITGGLGVSGRINAANFDGIVGANTAAAGSFTTINASTSITNAGLTSGRVTYAGASGLLSDSADFTYDATKLLVQKNGASNSTLLQLGNTNAGGAGSNMIFSGNGNTAARIKSYYTSAWALSLGTDSFLDTLFMVSGNVGIGTTSPGEKLTIDNGATGNEFIRFDKSTVFQGLVGVTQNAAQGSSDSLAGDLIARSQSGRVLIDTAGSTRMTITNSGSVGIGTSSPTKALTVSTNTSTDGILITGSTNPRLQVIDTTNSVTLELISGDSQSTIRTDTNHPIVFGTNGTERMQINAGAPILCLSGGSTTATGTGIAFPATQSASSDANTLDDYEEGTWTPALGSGVTTYATRNGVYTKIGRQVTVFFDIAVTTTTATGNMEIIGLPFAQASGNPIATGSFLPDGLDLPANTVSVSIVGTSGGSSTLRPFAAADNGGLSQVQYETGVAFTLYGAITYIV